MKDDLEARTEPQAEESPRCDDHGQGEAAAPMPAWARAAQAMPSRGGFVDVDDCVIHYLAWGDPALPPLLMVHGNAANAEWWRFIAPPLAADYHVIAPDLGGMGDSAHCGRYDLERYAEQVMAVVDTLAPGLAPFIVGHSLGGYVAIMAACAHGDRMAGRRARLPAARAGRRDQKIYPDRASALRRFKVLPYQPVNCAFYLDHLAQHSIKPEGGGWRWKFDPAALTHPRRLDYMQDLLDMCCPVALKWGELSERYAPASRAFTRATFNGVLPLVEIANARHHIMLDEPLALVVALRAQLQNWRLGVCALEPRGTGWPFLPLPSGESNCVRNQVISDYFQC